MCCGDGYDCGRVAVFCISRKNEGLGAKDGRNTRSFFAPVGACAHGAGFKSGVFWPGLM